MWIIPFPSFPIVGYWPTLENGKEFYYNSPKSNKTHGNVASDLEMMGWKNAEVEH